MTPTRTIYLSGATEEQRTSVEKFFDDAGIPVIWADKRDGADVVIDWPEGRLESHPDFLHAGGRITCPDSFASAGRMRIERGVMGELLNHLGIKINSCQLGCF
jgi:hypothetical protein